MARLPALLRRVQPEDVKAVFTWGVAATTGSLYLIQPWDWLRRTFLEKQRTRI
ncbi:hypothetical protein HN51_026167 [Arachis hypogaea]